MKLTYKKVLTLLALITSVVWLTVYSFPDNRLHVIFCDVGQGDATLISKGFNQILIDGGPNDKVLDCLAKNMPFYDRTIEIVALTHPEADHMTGIISVLEKYKVQYFLSGPEGSEAAGYEALLNVIPAKAGIYKNNSAKENILYRFRLGGRNDNGHDMPGLCKGRPCTARSPLMKIINPYAGDKIKLGDIVMESIWPTKEFAMENIENVIPAKAGIYTNKGALLYRSQIKSGMTSGVAGMTGNNDSVLGARATDTHLNDFSLVFLVTYDNKGFCKERPCTARSLLENNKRILFMGDADIRVQDEIINENFKFQISNFKLDILKYPHHGSKTGTSVDFLEQIKPKEAVISVGKNSFGHPTEEALDLLRSLNVKTRRTDIEGDIKYVF